MSKRALITGASSGIGREFAVQLAGRGYRITGVARRKDLLDALMAELPGEEHDYLVADLSTPEGVSQVSDAIGACHFNLLINNAGYSVLQPFYESPLQVQQDILSVSCATLLHLSHSFLRQSETGDALINVGSIVSFLPTPAQPVYSASKAFIAAFSECLWEEHRQRGVYVMALCPGLTKTDFITTATGGDSDGQNLPEIMSQSVSQVVSEALTALDKRHKPVIVTGWINRVMVALMPRFMSRFRLLKVLAVMGDPEKQL